MHQLSLALALLCLLTALADRDAAARTTGEQTDMTKLLYSRDVDAQLAWGQRYEHGEGVDRNITLAIRLYCRAGWGGAAEAQYRLGWIYANGRGADRDDDLAAQWFALAARSGDKYAERMLRQVGGMPRKVAKKPDCALPPLDKRKLRPVESVPDPSPQLIAEWVEQLAPQYGLEPALVLAVMRAESNFNPRARSPKNAQGLMQLMPDTARRFGVRDIWDPVENIKGGMAYLEWLLGFFDGKVHLALAGYNAGEQAVVQYRGVPPYAETLGYIKRVTLYMQRPVETLIERGA